MFESSRGVGSEDSKQHSTMKEQVGLQNENSVGTEGQIWEGVKTEPIQRKMMKDQPLMMEGIKISQGTGIYRDPRPPHVGSTRGVGSEDSKQDSTMKEHAGPKNENSGDHVAIASEGKDTDVMDYVISIIKGLESFSWVESKTWTNCSIFKVPKNLRDIDPNAYSPQILSIGPLHRHHPHVQSMEEHKRRFLFRHLDRTKRSPHFYVDAISNLKQRARQCYSWCTEREMGDEEFVQMLLLDACFIVELLLAFANGYAKLGYPLQDPVFGARGILKVIQRDLLLLENQIPLFVLDCFFKITVSCGSVAALAVCFFESAIPGYLKNAGASMGGEANEGLHLLDVVRRCIVPSKWLGLRMDESSLATPKFYQAMPPPISTLRDSGVKFVKKESGRLTEVELDKKKGYFHIPPLVIDDSISVLLNLVAFEQCRPDCSDEMSLYVSLMDALIDSPRDVAYLQRKGIIDNRLGCDQVVAKLFNHACREVVVDTIAGSRFAKLREELNERMEQNWPSWKVSLKREHFRHPWSALSLLAAVLIIIFTIVQVIYAIIAYHLPP